jgi:hypothetical protein
VNHENVNKCRHFLESDESPVRNVEIPVSPKTKSKIKSKQSRSVSKERASSSGKKKTSKLNKQMENLEIEEMKEVSKIKSKSV